MKRRRGVASARGLPVAAGLAILIMVAACQQPTPGVTVQSGPRVVRDSATVYVRSGKEVRGSGAVKVLAVLPGAAVGIDVDRAIAARGWSVYITTGTSTRSTIRANVPKGRHHFAFDFGSEATDIVISEPGTGSSPQGLWAFRLQPAT